MYLKWAVISIWHQKPKQQQQIRLVGIHQHCASKDTDENVKRQPTEWKKMFVNHVSDRYLISIIYKEL